MLLGGSALDPEHFHPSQCVDNPVHVLTVLGIDNDDLYRIRGHNSAKPERGNVHDRGAVRGMLRVRLFHQRDLEHRARDESEEEQDPQPSEHHQYVHAG